MSFPVYHSMVHSMVRSPTPGGVTLKKHPSPNSQVGCLRAAGVCDLNEVPEGDWFCCPGCQTVRNAMATLVEAGEVECSDDGHTWRVMKGKDGTLSTTKQLTTVLETLQVGSSDRCGGA